jgi:hypothetical protein
MTTGNGRAVEIEWLKTEGQKNEAAIERLRADLGRCQLKNAPLLERLLTNQQAIIKKLDDLNAGSWKLKAALITGGAAIVGTVVMALLKYA